MRLGIDGAHGPGGQAAVRHLCLKDLPALKQTGMLRIRFSAAAGPGSILADASLRRTLAGSLIRASFSLLFKSQPCVLVRPLNLPRHFTC